MNKFQELKEFIEKEYNSSFNMLSYAYIGFNIVRNKMKELENKETCQSLSSVGY